MKVGDLVELRSKIHHASGVYRSGTIGMIVMIDKHIQVIFGDEVVGCHWRELGVVDESR